MPIKQSFTLYGDDAISRIKQAIVSSGAHASGASSRSLAHAESDAEFNLYGAEHFKWMEQGRKGGKVPKDFIKIIMVWMQDKGLAPRGIDPEKLPEIRSAAFLIARKIKNEGTSLYRNKSFRDIYSSIINEDSLQQLFEDIGQQKSVEVLSDIVDSFKN